MASLMFTSCRQLPFFYLCVSKRRLFLTKLVFTRVNGENDENARPVSYRYGSLSC